MGNNIPQGYKATALGIIPQEWEVMRLGDIVSITSGESPSLYHLKAEGKYPYVKERSLPVRGAWIEMKNEICLRPVTGTVAPRAGSVD